MFVFFDKLRWSLAGRHKVFVSAHVIGCRHISGCWAGDVLE